MLSYERYKCIAYPFKMALSKKCMCMVCFCFFLVISLILYFPLHIPRFFEGMGDIKSNLILQFVVLAVADILDCILPSILMGYFYFGIKRTLRKRDKEMRNALSSNVLNNSQPRNSESSVKDGHSCKNKRHRDTSFYSISA